MVHFINSLVRPPLALMHDFRPPPYGGGNQFMLAFKRTVEQRGIRCSANIVGRWTRACLFNSMNFDAAYLYDVKRRYPNIRMVHRVDGPKASYRGYDDGSDRKVWEYNRDLADASIFQSEFSLGEYRRMGYEFRSPCVIPNAVDSAIFHESGRIAPPDGCRKVRLISTAWSDNPNKGADTLEYLDAHLDKDRYEFRFVGRTSCEFNWIRLSEPVASPILAGILRQHDIYIAASINDPCSNALLEALACGLPAVYRKSGGHPEIVKNAGVGFVEPAEAPSAIEKVLREYLQLHASIEINRIEGITELYLACCQLK